MDTLFKNTVNLRRKRNADLWRTNSLINLSRLSGSSESSIFESGSDTSRKSKRSNRRWNTIVTIVLVEAKSLPSIADDGHSHNMYCKFRLGSETFKSKSVPSCQNPEWRERFQLHLYDDYVLSICLWDKGKMKNSMGSCILDLSPYEKERTHEIWRKLDDGYGAIHISVTMCAIRDAEISLKGLDTRECNEKHDMRLLSNDWNVVGMLHVNVIGAKGFTNRPNAYCTLEIDNERVETHRVGASTEPRWNKCYVFKVYDVTSTLDLKVYDSSLANALLPESIGKVSIPLLRITNDATRWYALKDRSKRNNAKGNCPRILLRMRMVWNPIKATMRLFQSKEMKYIKKPAKFDVFLIYSNMKFVSDLLSLAADLNEHYKRLFEWEDEKFSFFVLLGWLISCFYIRLWIVPLLFLAPFISYWIFKRRDYTNTHGDGYDDVLESVYIKEDKTFTGKLQDLQKMTLTITNGIEFIVSHIERLYNLVTFKVPFLSYVTMILLIAASAVLFVIPFNYLLMGLGIYKFTRKYLNPARVPNNDLLDFLSRVPDNEMLKDWKELGVPEPNQDQQSSKLVKSISTSI
ncbi:multiple C2 and transmembrane domain-containing protein-like [Melitaea cinxia]|uniref:multiple C2 and transmembrane domain-containing protein-like n=1 Tax=Melitaea cinxia TaxID=113334 RepID=UPI001E270F72|nr:multiple C2 and transmembrane domain-containing protein-like [Melitaea cinxia]